MIRLGCIRCVAALAMAAVAAGACVAAEVRLKTDAYCRGSLVRLGDLADICSSDSQLATALKQVELFPAPPAGRTRVVRLREIQDLLSLRGVGLADFRFFGSSVVNVHSAAEETVARPAITRLTAVAVKQAERRVQQAVVRYLDKRAGGKADWTVSVQLDRQQTQAVGQIGGELVVSGPTAPLAGLQDFVISSRTSPTVEPVAVRVDVSLPLTVVAATRSLRRGEMIRPGDVRLIEGRPDSPSGDPVRRIEAILGKETTRSIATGQVIDRRYVRSPILVRRGEIVTVFVRAPGVKITTDARSIEEGAKGDLITVQPLTSRERYAARVTGIQEVAVYPRRTASVRSAASVSTSNTDKTLQFGPPNRRQAAVSRMQTNGSRANMPLCTSQNAGTFDNGSSGRMLQFRKPR